ncbi:MAG: hypothetical protein J6Q27_00640 [Clostridia bacterium]|nr:hypothetical protein [Clostridia bacterium]
MKLKEVQQILHASVAVAPSGWEDMEVVSACGSDLMSDVLAFVKNQALLLTGLMNPQVIRTAEMMDMKAIVFVRGKSPSDEVNALAEKLGMTILTTEIPLYVACGKLYTNGLSGGGE